MRAVQIMELGRPLELREVPLPQAGPGEVRVKVEAAGICHSDVHYRAGTASVAHRPITPGHEIAGRVDAIGAGVDGIAIGDRVALHYLVTCGECEFCRRGQEQFCVRGRMLGKHLDGGYAEYLVVPARNAIAVPDNVPATTAAVMMCSTATAFHALHQARLVPGDRVAIFGVGGLGLSAIRLARLCGAGAIYAIDIDAAKLASAATLGAIPINATAGPAERQILDLTHGRGVDVALEFAGLPQTQQQAVASLAVHGRAALAGITSQTFAVRSFADVICHESSVIGVSDHLRDELVTLLGFAARGQLDVGDVVAEAVPLDAAAINARLDALAGFHGRTRSVIVPEN